MSNKPIFCCTHPRACSTAFERVFMTRRDTLSCVHEPFGDAFYYGPERLSSRFANDEEARKASGFDQSTFQTIFDRIEREGSEGKRLFIKDIVHYLVPPKGQPAMLAPSLLPKRRGVGTDTQAGELANGDAGKTGLYPWSTAAEPNNPTVVPSSMLQRFHWMFLIRDPHRSIPSYYRCTIPPLDDMTGFYEFYPSEAGYVEVRQVFDYLRSAGIVGPHYAEGSRARPSTNGAVHTNGDLQTNGTTASDSVEICVLDADDMLDAPAAYIEAVCKSLGIPYTPDMLTWNNEVDQQAAHDAFEKWTGFHEDAIDSEGLEERPDGKKSWQRPARTEQEWDEDWTTKYGEKGAKIIRNAVDLCMDDYNHLKQFALKL